MVVFDIHPWLRLSTGLILGGWIGVAVGFAITLLFSAKRLHQLETVNVLLRTKLRAREKAQRPGPVLIMPPLSGNRTGTGPLRAAGGR
jgi:hypothetical protein